jgi:hypothetical protein
MIGRSEIRRALDGAWLLFLNRPEGMHQFDISIEGFWRSFQAIVLVAPAYALTVIAKEQRTLADPAVRESFSQSIFFLDNVLTFGIDWITFPILLALAARPLGIAQAYPGYIIARNWSAVISATPFAAIALLTVLGIFGDQASAILWLAALAVMLRYNFLVARIALGTGIGPAVGIVVADFAVSLLIAGSIDSLFGLVGSQ